MTPTQQQPTPYDEEIESARHNPDARRWLELHEAKRDGYLRAKAEDADLLAALVALKAYVLRILPPVFWDNVADIDEIVQAHATIAKHKGKETKP